jgi:hypothetical protein
MQLTRETIPAGSAFYVPDSECQLSPQKVLTLLGTIGAKIGRRCVVSFYRLVRFRGAWWTMKVARRTSYCRAWLIRVPRHPVLKIGNSPTTFDDRLATCGRTMYERTKKND